MAGARVPSPLNQERNHRLMATDGQGALYEQAPTIDAIAGFQMQSFQPSTGAWTPMDQGSGGQVWRPRATAVDAAAKCLAWTGFTGIPAMQVINLATREVVWRCSDYYPQAGKSVSLPAADERHAYELATTTITEHHSHRPDDTDSSPLQTSLFELPGGDMEITDFAA